MIAGRCQVVLSSWGRVSPQTVVREVHEETGIDIEVVGLVGIYSDPKHVIAYDNGEVRQQFSLCFRAHPVGGTLCSSEESTDVKWIAPADLDALNFHPTMRLRIDHGVNPTTSSPYIG